MNRPLKFTWGIATILPMILVAVAAVLFITSFLPLVKSAGQGPSHPPDPAFFIGFISAYIIILFSILLGFGLKISYFIHLIRNEDLSVNEKVLWVCMFLVFTLLAMAVYWFMRVWPDRKTTRKSASSKRKGPSLLRICLLVLATILFMVGLGFCAFWFYGPLDRVIAHTQAAMGLHDQAARFFEHALRRSPGDAGLMSRVAHEDYEMKTKEGYEGATRNYADAIGHGADTYENHFWLGCAYRHVGENKKSIEELDRALQIKPGNYYSLLNRALALSRVGQRDRALKDFTRCIELKPGNSWGYIDRGMVYQDSNKYELALKDFNKAIELDKSDKMAFYFRGNTLVGMERYDEALSSYNEAIRLDPKYGSVYDARAQLDQLMGNTDLEKRDRLLAVQNKATPGVYD